MKRKFRRKDKYLTLKKILFGFFIVIAGAGSFLYINLPAAPQKAVEALVKGVNPITTKDSIAAMPIAEAIPITIEVKQDSSLTNPAKTTLEIPVVKKPLKKDPLRCYVKQPKSFQVHGIDVSKYQKKIDWEKINACPDNKCKDVSFVFIRATVGDKTDPLFKSNWEKGKEHKLIVGAYQYLQPSKNATVQARQFIKTVKLGPGDLPPVLDIENANRKSKKEVIAKVKVWLDIVEKHYGVKPIIYSGENFYNHYLKGHFNGYPVWIANYSKKKPVSRKFINWNFWQYTDKGKRHGISGNVDYNVFYGSFEELEELCIQE